MIPIAFPEVLPPETFLLSLSCVEMAMRLIGRQNNVKSVSLHGISSFYESEK